MECKTMCIRFCLWNVLGSRSIFHSISFVQTHVLKRVFSCYEFLFAFTHNHYTTSICAVRWDMVHVDKWNHMFCVHVLVLCSVVCVLNLNLHTAQRRQ